MKRTVIILLIMIANNTILSSQNKVEIVSDTTLIYAGYSAKLEKPIVINGLKFMKNNADVKLFVFNEHSFKYFQDLRKLLKEENGDNLSLIIEEYNEIIAKNHSLYDALSKKSKEQQTLSSKTIEELEFSLKNLESTVNLTQNSLLNANNTLDIATKVLKEHRKNNFWKNLGNVGTGTAIGLLLGILIAN